MVVVEVESLPVVLDIDDDLWLLFDAVAAVAATATVTAAVATPAASSNVRLLNVAGR